MSDTTRTDSARPSGLDFRPVHSGLGFHPFSDGLPYAPSVPSRPASTTSGAGATAAGPARPAFLNPLPNTTINPRTPVLQPAPRPLSSPIPTALLPRPEAFLRHEALQNSTKTAPLTAPEPVEKNFNWFYPIKRLLAFMLDGVFNMVVTAAIVTLALASADLEPWFLLDSGVIAISVFFLTLSCWALMTAQEIAFKTTLGKRLFGLKLRGSTTAIFLRSFFFIPSLAFCGAGIFWCLFDRDKRCWHDLAVDLQPTRITELAP